MRLSFGCLITFFFFVFPALAAPIHDAAKKGDVAGVTAALESGANVDESDGWATPLWYAARFGQEDVAKLLIAQGADVNLPTIASGPPLLGAVERKNGVLVKLLLASGANPNTSLETKSALFLAAKGDCLDCVIALVDKGADVNALNQDREPPIHGAKSIGSQAIADYLITHGAVQPKIEPISAKLSSADPAKGQAVFASNCARCHHIELKDGIKLGPNLWGVIGRQKASAENFAYSEALKDWGATWGYEDLNAFLWGPKIVAPGVKMQFAGIENDVERTDLIAYLRTQSNKPEPLP